MQNKKEIFKSIIGTKINKFISNKNKEGRKTEKESSMFLKVLIFSNINSI